MPSVGSAGRTRPTLTGSSHPKRLELACSTQFTFECRKWQYVRQCFVVQGNSAVAGIPVGGALVFGVDDQHNPADLGRDANASAPDRAQELTPESFPLHTHIRRKPREPEARHLMPGESLSRQFWRIRMINAARSDAVKAQNRLVVGVVDGEERLRPACLMALPRIALQVDIQIIDAAVE